MNIAWFPTPGHRARKRLATLFAVAFTVSFLISAAAVWFASTAPTVDVGDVDPIRTVLLVLGVNLVLILGLAALVGWRVLTVLASRAEDAGAALHLRYMALFAAAAVAPAVVVALFFGVLVNQGIENWFSDRVNTVVQNHAAVAKMLVVTQTERLNDNIGPLSMGLNRYIDQMATEPEAFNQMLAEQAQALGFSAIYVVNRRGDVLAGAEAQGAPVFVPPSEALYREADQAVTAAPYEFLTSEDLIRILFRLSAGRDTYVLVVAPMPPGMFERLHDSQDAVAAYLETKASRKQVQMVFMVSYVETALLVLIGAIWLGMTTASRIAEPVARLVKAANRVASGDLQARVDTGSGPEEINILLKSFNRMTDDLQQQQTALRSASIDAENRRQFIETVLSGVSAGVVGLDAEGRISAFNQQAAVLLDLTEEAARGAPVARIAPEFAEVVDEASRSGEAEAEIDLMRGTETRRLRVRAAGAAADGLVLTFDDITRLVAAQRNAAWKDVARRIAHEIKNPLTPIQLSAERLRRKYRKEISSDLETFDRCTDTIVRQVEDIGRMVDEFSAFARMPAPKFTPCDPAELLRQAVFARRVAHPDIDIEIDIEGENALIVCDERMVGQALTNVLKNAAEAVETRRHASPQPPGRIVARLSSHDGQLAYEVEDNGVGLPARDRDRLTEPYVTTREKGTGLGLAIVKRILEDHGGGLALRDSVSGQGALVTLTLPCGQPAPAARSAIVDA
jgi:two-component system nitrogen regulation sensor histidine kinase NtrY